MRKWIASIVMTLLGVCVAYAGGKRALLIGISDYPRLPARWHTQILPGPTA